MKPTINVIVAMLLLLCLADMPSGLYELVRFAVAGTFAYLSYDCFKSRKVGFGIIVASLALLFQPFSEVTFGLTFWDLAEVVVCLILIAVTVIEIREGIKNNWSVLATAFFAVVLCCSCSSKQGPINDLEDLAFELEENSEDYSQSDWEEAAIRYSEIEEQMEQYEYTDEELRQVGKLKAKCLKSIAKSSGKILREQIHSVQMQLQGAFDEIEDMFDHMPDE